MDRALKLGWPVACASTAPTPRVAARRVQGPAEAAVADLGDSVQTPWRGFVDAWDVQSGVRGWALRADAPLERMSLEVVIGETPWFEFQTGVTRSDIDALLGVKVAAGFHIPASFYARLAQLRSRRRNWPVRIRFAGTSVFLNSITSNLTVGQLVDAWREQILGSRRSHEVSADDGERLLGRLTALRAGAQSLGDLPLVPAAEREAGSIDAFHLGADGHLWFVGWMSRNSPTEFPLLFKERQAYPGGAATLQFERADLAARCVGVLGVVDCGWAPPAVMPDFFVYAGERGHLQLRVGGHTKLLGQEAFKAAYAEAQAGGSGGHREAFGALLTSGRNWLPGNAAAAGLAAEASIDRLWAVPGFGIFAEGWTLCPAKRVRSLQLKVGNCVLPAEDESTYYKPRPDLGNLFGGGDVVARAGFATVFRGDPPAVAGGAPLLRVVYADGSSSVHAVAPKILRRLDFLDDATGLLGLYPSLRHEPFYPELLAAVRRQLVRGGGDLRPIDVQRSPQVLVLRLPDSPPNLRLCFDVIARMSAEAPGLHVCLVADDGAALTEAKLLFHELRAVLPTTLSLVCLGDADQGFRALPELLAVLRADRFVYVDRGVLLTGGGWLQAAEYLQSGARGIHYFEFVDDSGTPDRINGSVSAACFGWTTVGLYSWLPTATPLLRGLQGTAGLPAPQRLGQVSPGAALRIERPAPSRLADLIDADLLAALGDTSRERLASV